MIAELAILATLALLGLPVPVALASFSLASLSAIVGCEVVCMEWVSPFLSSAILGFFISILSFVVPLDPLRSFVIDAVLSSAIALLYAKKFLERNLDGVAETLVALTILLSVGLAYVSPEATTQAMLSLTGSLWTVDPLGATVLALLTSAMVLLNSAYKNQLAAAMFDYEYLLITGRRPLFWAWLLFLFIVLGTSYASYTTGLLSSQVLIILPAMLSLKAGLKEMETTIEVTYTLALVTILIGCLASYLWGLPETGFSGIILIILIVSLDLPRRIGRKILLFKRVKTWKRS